MLLLASLPTVIGAAAVLPALMLLWLVVATDRRPQAPGRVGSAFFLGIVALFLTRYLVAPFHPFVEWADRPWPSVIARAIFVAAIPEETTKVALIAFFVMRLRAMHEPMDGLVYGAAVSLGFAACENLGYLARHAADWETLALARDFLTVPFHGALGIIAGAYLGRARFAGRLRAHRSATSLRVRFIVAAWVVPVLLHAAFDLPLLALRRGLAGGTGETALRGAGLLVGFGTIVLAAWTALRIAERQKTSPRLRRVPPGRWRGVWALLIAGTVLAFTGAALLVSQAHRAWFSGGVEAGALIAGALALAAAIGIFLFGRQHILQSAENAG